MNFVWVEPWSFRAYHGQFAGSPPSSSSSGSSATTPWGSTSPSPSSRWSRILTQGGHPDDLNQTVSRWATAQAPRCGLCKTILQYLGVPRIELWSLVLSSTAMSSSRCILPQEAATSKTQVPGGRMAEMYGTKKVLGYRFAYDQWQIVLCGIFVSCTDIFNKNSVLDKRYTTL